MDLSESQYTIRFGNVFVGIIFELDKIKDTSGLEESWRNHSTSILFLVISKRLSTKVQNSKVLMLATRCKL